MHHIQQAETSDTYPVKCDCSCHVGRTLHNLAGTAMTCSFMWKG